MTPRQRVLTCLEGGTPDEVPMRDMPTLGARKRWEREGMREGGWPSDFFENCIDGAGFDDSLRLPSEVIEDNGRVRVVRTANGVTQKIIPNYLPNESPVDSQLD